VQTEKQLTKAQIKNLTFYSPKYPPLNFSDIITLASIKQLGKKLSGAIAIHIIKKGIRNQCAILATPTIML
tara:strand:+ start:63 stop:275 length:213 start_codon:yes stop_codon:yes gene_type:complete